jgi:hypothetical protein
LYAKLLHCDLGNLCRIVNTSRGDLDDLSCDEFSDGIVSVNEVERAQSLFQG